MVERETDVEGVGAEGPFRIAAVSELTGVPEPTLRAWERRYGIPSPQRTASGYRLYGASDVDQVRQMRRLCDGGMAASDAARVLSSRLAGPAPARALTPDAVGDPYDASSRALLDAVERFDDDGLELELRRLMVTGDAAVAFDRVLAPTLRKIGDKWHAGELSVAQEHFASQRIGAVLRDLMRLSPAPVGADRALLASFADDDHELGLVGVGIRFSGWGLRPVFLGARTPPPAVRSAVQAVAPKLVALSITMPLTRARARELLEEYGAACGSVPWLVGGAQAEKIADLVKKFGGEVAPEDADALGRLVRRLVRTTRGHR